MVTGSEIVLAVSTAKGLGGVADVRKPLYTIPRRCHPIYAQLLLGWHRLRSDVANSRRLPQPALQWALPYESGASWTADTLTQWLRLACGLVAAAPPAGFSWTSHSLRKGGATAAHAAGVLLGVIRYRGGWSRASDVVLDYIDPAVMNTPAGRFFFYWLTPSGQLDPSVGPFGF